MEYVWIDKTALVGAISVNTDATEHEVLNIVNTVLYKQSGRHVGECAIDEKAREVCEGVYLDRVDDNLALCEALRAVYALAGENKQVQIIVNDAIRDHGISA